MEADEQGYRSIPLRKSQKDILSIKNKFNLQYAKHFWEDGFRGTFNEKLYKALMRIKYN